MAFHHLGHLTQAQRRVVDGHARQVLRRGDGQEVLDPEPLIGRIDPAAGTGVRGVQKGQGRYPHGVPSGGDDLLLRHTVRAQLFLVDEYLHLPIPLSPDGHIGHPGDAHQAGLDRPTGEHRHLDGGHCLRGQPDRHDPAGRRHGLEYGRRFGDVWQHKRHGQALLHQLPGMHEAGPGLEDHQDGRQSGNRLGVHGLQPRRAAEQLLYVKGDHAFHFGGG